MLKKKKLFLKKLFFSLVSIFYLAIKPDEECKSVISFLTSPGIKIENLLYEDSPFNLIRTTNTRDILTTPTGLFYNQNNFFLPQVNIDFFFIQISGGIALSPDSKELISLFNMPTIDGVFKLSSVLLNGKQYSAIDFPFILNTFRYITVNDIRLGSIIQGSHEIKKNILLYAQIPFTYNAYYLSLPPETQSTLSTEIAKLQFSEKENKNKKDERNVIIEHTVADFFGIERSIIGLLYKSEEERVNIEGRIFFPSGIIKRGIIGGNFSNIPEIIPQFSFKQFIFDILAPSTIKYETNIDSVFTNTIDKIVGTIYGNAFGQDGYGISPSIYLRFPIEKSLSLNLYGTYIYNFSTKKTIYGYKNTLTNVPKIKENITETEACTILSLFDQEFANKISLYPANVLFSYGNETQGSISIQSTNSKEKISLGLDMWHKFSTQITGNSGIKNIIIPERQFDATQINLFVDLELFKNLKNSDIIIQFLFQSSLYAVGIGKEYGGKIQLTYVY